MKTIRLYSFFSGAGFLDLGFESEGYQIDFVNEYSSSFLEAYKYSRSKMKISAPQYGYYCGDINELLRGKQKKKLLRKLERFLATLKLIVTYLMQK